MLRLGLAVILGAMIATPPPEAQDGELQLNADFAWGRHYRPGSPNPVVVTIDNPGPEITGTIQLRWSFHPNPIVASDAGLENLEGGFGSIHEIPVVIPKSSRRRYFVSVESPGGARGSLWAILAGSKRAPKPFGITATAIPPGELAVAVIGTGEAPGLSRAGARLLLARPDELPDRWHGYDPLDIALWLEGDAASMVDPAQVEALKRWIAFGGHLIVARASSVGFAGTFLEDLAGVRAKEIRPHGEWTGLATLAQAADGPMGEATILDVSPQGGEVLARSGDKPLIVRRYVGRGRVTFLAFDPSSDVFRNWSYNGRFWKQLADLPDSEVNPRLGRDGRRARGMSRGPSGSWQVETAYDGILGSGMLAGHMMAQPGVPVPPIGAGLLLLLIYAALIGPVDYLVLRRLKRLERTWITFPAAAIAFALVLVTVGLSMKRNAAMVRDLVVEDHLGQADLVRAWSVTTVTLPDKDVISARLPHRDGSLRAYDRQSGAPGRVGEGRVEDWNFPYGAVGLAVGEWCVPGSKLRVERAGEDRIRVVNDSGTELVEAVYAEGEVIRRIGRIPQGESFHDLGADYSLRDFGVATPEYVDYSYRHQVRSEMQWTAALRKTLVQMSLGPPHESNRDRGIASALDVRPWLARGGGMLMGWTEGDPVLELSRGAGSRPVYRLLRGFTRHD